MTTLNSLRSTFSDIQQPRPKSGTETPHPVRRTARRLFTAAACGLFLAAASPAGVHAFFDPSAASDTLRVTLSAPEGGTVAEGSTGHFEVSVAGSTAAGEVTIRYSVSGTAVAGEDYTALSGEATVSQGENTARIALEALKDGILDKGETVVLALTGATGPGTVLVDQTAATATIADNGTVSVELAAVSDTIGEGSTWNSSVIMSMPVADRISLRWRTQDGTALAGRDYKAADEVVTFQPGETVKPISVETLEDDNTEAVEVFYVSLGLAVDAARAGTEGAFKVDSKPQSAFIECSVAFPPNVKTMFELVAPVPADTVFGTVAANTTDGIPYYELDDGGENKFTINSLTAQISTTAALDPGLYELEVTVHDECGAQASIDVSVNVTQPNRPPVVDDEIEDMTLHVGDEKEIDLSKVFSDPDEDVLSYEAVSSKPAVATAVVSGTTLTVTAKGQGEATVTVTAKDPDDLEVTDAFKVTVPNRAPKPVGTITDRTVEVDESESVTVSSYFNDPDRDKLTYSAESSDATKVGVSVQGTEVTYTGKSAGSATVTVTANDGHSGTAQQAFRVTVPEPNEAPVVDNPISDLTLYVGDGPNEKVIDLSKVFRDPDGDDLSYEAISSDPDVATATWTGSTLTVTAKGKGDATVTVTANDGDLEAKDEFDVEVPNRAPVVVNRINDLTLYVGEGTTQQVIDLSNVFRDPDGDDLSYEAVSSDADVATATVSGNTLTVTAKGKGETTVTVTATDPGDLAIVDEFDVEVPNRAPKVENALPDLTLYVGEGTNEKEIDLADVFSDPDRDDLDYKVESSDTDVATAVLRGTRLTVEATGKGETTVTLTADDGMGGTEEDVFVVRVPNRKPTAKGTISDRGVDVGDSGSVTVSSYFSDPDKDELDYTATSSRSSVVEVSIDGSRVTYKGLKKGTATVTVTAEDTGNLTARQQFEVEVYEPNPDCKIEVSAAQLSVREDAGVGDGVDGEVGVSANADCGTLRYALSGTGSGDFSVAGASDDNAKIKVRRGLNHEGRESYDLTLTVSWGSVSKAADVDITVTDVNEPPTPVGTIRARTVRVGQPVSLDVTGYFTDEDAGIG